MAVLSRDDFFGRIHDRFGSDTSDEGISFIEDMTDTYNSLEKQANGDGVNWEQKYHDLDESWKKRYTHRFFSGGSDYTPEKSDDPSEPSEEEITIEELFKED